MVKKVFVILFSLLLSFNSFGYIFVYLQVKGCLKDESFVKLKEYIPEDELEVIVINKDDNSSDNKLEFLDEDEIKYCDKMYDVYKKVEKGNSIYYYCIGDEKENILNKAFLSYIKDVISKDTPQPALKNILLIKLSVAIISKADDLIPQTNEKLISCSKLFLTTNYTEVLTPPPRLSIAI
jgi:hypothetical protein